MTSTASCPGDIKLSPEDLRKMFLTMTSYPVALTDCISDWPAKNWTVPALATVLPHQKLSCRIGKKDATDVQWETECSYEDVTLLEFSQWLSEEGMPQNPLSQYDRSKHWAYIDYKYMKDVFSTSPDLLKAVNWRQFGFDGRDGAQSTIWVGSEQAYTLGHYDTYGCNLVAQISGRKRWILFPPDDTIHLYPSRVPFEESSVFSDINITKPNLETHPRFKAATPYIITLEPGQVLFVPHHWWHFVECLEPSISVNTWIELESDKEARLQEAVTRTLACLFTESCMGEKEDILNINQEFYTLEENKAAIDCALEELMVDKTRHTEERGDFNKTASAGETRKRVSDSIPPVREKSLKSEESGGDSDMADVSDSPGKDPANRDTQQHTVTFVKPSSFQEYLTVIQCDGASGVSPQNMLKQERPLLTKSTPAKILNESNEDSSPSSSVTKPSDKQQLTTRTLLNCLTHPSVITLVSDLLKSNLNTK